MLERWKKDRNISASNDTERRMLALIHRLKLAVKDLRGSAGAQLKKRNEVRALQKEFGCQALFFTSNPADIFNILVHVLSGKDPDTFQALSALERAKQAATNPAACARFFTLLCRLSSSMCCVLGRTVRGCSDMSTLITALWRRKAEAPCIAIS